MKKYLLIIISAIFIVTLFAQKTLNIFKSNLSVLNVSTSTVDSLKFTHNDTIMDIHSSDASITSLPISAIDSLNLSDSILKKLPVVITTVATSISYTTAKAGLVIKSVGGTTLLEKGICWSMNATPTIDSNKVVSSVITSIANVNITGLTAGKTIHFRAYAKNIAGTSYGEELSFTTLNYSLPVVVTNLASYNYTTQKIACIANVSNNGGCTLTERGICWSTTKNSPTIIDSKLASGTSIGQFYPTISSITYGSTYYIRTYATNCVGTSYGNVLSVKPIMGNVTYTLDIDSAANPEPYRLIKIAMDSACGYYNRYTNFRGNVSVYYNAGIPTAQASYHGSIGFGPLTRYMWVGTAIHEMCHFVGSGTTTAWQNKIVGGIWTGTTGATLLKSLKGETLKGDTQHFWPYGINQKEEITGLGGVAAQATGLATCAKLAKAMCVDDCGLPTSW